METRQRYTTILHGVNDAGVKNIIKKALELANEFENVSRIVLVSYTLTNAEWIERIYGKGSLKNFIKGVKFQGCKVPVKYESLNTYRHLPNEIIITLGLRSDDILKLDNNNKINSILSFPWILSELEKWSKITESVCIDNNLPTASYPNPDCIVRSALATLNEGILVTGLSHASDKECAQKHLEALKSENFNLDELEIESFLFKELNWKKEFIDEFIELVKRLNNGRILKKFAEDDLKALLDRWKNICDPKNTPDSLVEVEQKVNAKENSN